MTRRLTRGIVSVVLRRISVGSLVVVEGGERHVYGSGSPRATTQVRSSRVWPMLLRGSRGLAEAYAQGLWDQTLRGWRANLTGHAAALGYDERFRRIWMLYLADCEAGFAERRVCDIQLLLTKPRSQLTSDDRPGSRGRSGPHNLAASA